jgi:GAF domain-containing protein
MSSTEIAAIEPKLKEILYRCLEEVRATKAALYLINGENSYSLVTYYGFRDLDRKQIDARDDLIDRLIVKRTPFYVNSLTEDPRFSAILFAASTTRMLLAPIYSRGKLIGFIDMRDKAAKQPFTPADLADTQKIVEQFIELFAQRNLFGQRPAPATPPRPVPEVPTQMTNALAAIDEAKRAVARGILRGRNAPETLNESQLDAGSAVLPAILSLPGVLFAALSSFGKFAGLQRIAARAEFRADASAKFEAKLRGWLQKRAEPEGLSSSEITFPLGKGAAPLDANRLATVLSAPVRVSALRGVVLTVGFDAPPTALTRQQMADLLNKVEIAIAQAMSHERLSSALTRVAEKLLEPDYQRYPVLVAHARRVSDLAERLARAAGLPQHEVEMARIAGLVHDVGMRMLDYHTLYRKGTLTAEEMRIVKEHPIVGAALVADSALGADIAHIVLCHHERPDGTGYPHGLSGDAIPMISRIIHVCEAYDAMTAADSYQTAVPQAAALARIRRVAGAQLDEELANRFVELLSTPEMAVR